MAGLVVVECALSKTVEFPAMRAQVMAALQSLSDPAHQKTRWGKVEDGVNYYDDLDLSVSILYDDCEVLPDPASAVGTVVMESEVESLRGLHDSFGPMLDDLGDQPDVCYLNDVRWTSVVDAARRALETMRSS